MFHRPWEYIIKTINTKRVNDEPNKNLTTNERLRTQILRQSEPLWSLKSIDGPSLNFSFDKEVASDFLAEVEIIV